MFTRFDNRNAVIALRAVHDAPKHGAAARLLAQDVTLDIPPGNYALLSRDALLGKHAIDVFSGLRPPAAGHVSSRGVPSWPIGRAGFIRGRVTGHQIVALVARRYELDLEVCLAFMEEILTDAAPLSMRVDHWPIVFRMEFTHALALLPGFDLYFVDGVFPFGRTRFTTLWQELFEARRKGKTLILSTTRLYEARAYCDKAIVVDGGNISIEDDLEAALAKFPPRPRFAAGLAEQSQNDGEADNDAF